MKILGVSPRKHQHCFFLETTCPYSFQSDKYHLYCLIDLYLSRSSRPEMFYKKAVHRNFAKFTGKYLSQSLFFNKVAILRPDLRSSQRRCSVREGIQEHLRWLLPNISEYLLCKTFGNGCLIKGF